MKKIILSISYTILSIAIYFITFSAHWDTLFPYYLEEYLTYYFLIGLVVIVLSPFVITFYKRVRANTSFKINYLGASNKTNLGAVLVCIFTFIYSSIGITYSENNDGYYKIQTSEK
jgi:hypothetical protein